MRNTLLSGLSSLLLPLGLYGASATAASSYQRTYLSSSISASSDQLLRTSTALPRDLIDLSGDQLDIQTAHPVRELVIVDGAVAEADKSVLRRALKPGMQLVELDSSVAGLPQLINALDGHKNLAAIHVISHAEAGVILLGNSRITPETIQQEVYAFAALKGAVREGGDLLFYGCDLAANEAGEALLDIISNNTGLDVAASNNLTGNSELQGDWDLEVTRGNVESTLAFSEKALRDFSGVLAPFTGIVNFSQTKNAGDYYGNATVNAEVWATGTSGYFLTIDGATRATELYTGLGSTGQAAFTLNTENSVTLRFNGNAPFSPQSLKVANIAGGGGTTHSFTFTSNKGSFSQNVVNGTPATVDLTSFGANVTYITISSTLVYAWMDNFDVVGVGITVDETAPVFQNGTPSVGSQTLTGATLSADLDEEGTVYYVVVADGASAPSVTQVRNGQNSSGAAALASGNFTTTSTTGSEAFSGLSSGTNYDLYVVAQDDEGTPNVQASATLVNFATQAANSDATLTAAGGVSEPVGLATTIDSVGEAVDVFDFTISDGGTSDGLATTVSQIVVSVSGTSTDAERSKITWRLNGPDASNVTGTYSAGADTITFSGLSVSVADGGNETYTVNAYYNDNTALTEDRTIILSVDGDTNLTVGGSGTQMASGQSAVTNGSGTTIDVVASQLVFTTQPAGSVSGAALTTQPVVRARDAFGNTDVDFTETITLTEASAGTLTNGTQAATAGVATFTNLTYTATADQQAFTLTANDQDGVGSNLPTADANSVSSDVVATKLLFTTQPAPTSVTSGAATNFSTVPVISAADVNDIVDTGYSTGITLAEVNGAGSATMTGTGDTDGNSATVSITPSSGVSTFTGMQITYTNSGAGSETFNLRASSGGLTTADSSQLTAATTPSVTDGNISISGASGTSGAYKIGDTVTATWNNTAGGDNNAGITGVTVDFSQFGGGAAVVASNSSDTWTATYTITAGAIDAANRNVSITATNAAGPTTTADTTNATVDNVAPVVTNGSISISGATGTSGAYKIGDTVTASWDNSAIGDDNSDTISSATVNFSQFGGGAAVAATNSSGTWTATYTIVAGAIDSTNRNISFSATDNAGNATTTADTTNATLDNVAPFVSDVYIGISGGTGTAGAYIVGDTVTASWDNSAIGDNNSDTISSVTVDFSQFGGGAAVVATNSSGTWTATYTVLAGAINATNRNVSVTATDNVGNTRAQADSSNAAVDNIAPSVSSIGVSGTPGSGDTSMAFTANFSESVVNVSTDDFTLVGTGSAAGSIASVSASSGSAINVNIASISGTGTLKVNLNASTNVTDNAGNTVAAYSSGSTHSVSILTAPDAPTIGTATAGDGQVDVTFTAPGSNGGSAITTYTATASPSGAFGTCAGPAACTATVTGLSNGTAYTFTVTATNAIGTSVASGATAAATPKGNQTITFTNPGAQNFGSAPTLSGTATSSLAVNFSSTTTGICTITGGGALTFVAVGTCTIDADQVGNGSWNAATTVTRSFTVNAVVPNAPTIGTATAGDTQASVTFTAPASTGGAAITGYTVTSNPGGITATGANSPITVTGLTNGVTYTFTVTATNLAGTGSASGASNSITPAAPQTITFANPGAQNFGTAPTLSATADSGLTPVFTSSTPAVCTITSVGALTFVSAGTCTINSDQAGNASYLPATQVSRSFTVNTVVPGAPTAATAIAGNAQASVSFIAPVFTGGVAITSYTVTANPGGATATGASSPIDVVGLTNGTAYTFTVTATNSVGTGAASVASSAVIPKATQTISFNNPGTQNLDSSLTVTASASSGLTPTFTSFTISVCTVTTGGAVTLLTTGTCTLSANQVGNTVYFAATPVTRSFTVDPIPNYAPTISGSPGTSTAQGVAYSFTPTAADQNSDPLTFSIINKPSWASFSAATGVLSGTPGNADVGVTTGIVISVSDGILSTSLPAFGLAVVNVNDTPVISGSPAITVNQDEAYQFIPTASDLDGDALTYSIINQPTWASFNTATGALSGTPANANVGVTNGIVISVSDGTLSASLPAFSLTVVNINEVPVITGVPTVKVDQDIAYLFAPTSSDPDGDTLSFTIANKPAWASFDTATGQLAGTPVKTDVGTTTGIIISVSDGTLSAVLPAFNIEVVSTVDPLQPVVTAPADLELNATALYTPVDIRQVLGISATASATEVEQALKGLASDGVSGKTCCTASAEGLSATNKLLLVPGRHEVKWKAINSVGVIGEATQIINLHPLVSLNKSQLAVRGSQVELRVLLNGAAPKYPFSVPYEIDASSTAALTEHNLRSGVASFSQEGQLEVVIPVAIAALTGLGDSQLVVNLGAGINAGAAKRHVIEIRQGNVPPVVDMVIRQGGIETSLITPNGGPVIVSASVSDANKQDTHTFDWSSTTGLADTDGNPVNASRTFDPTGLNGSHQLQVSVTDSAGAVVQTQTYLRVVASLPLLSETTDADKDGFSDALEGTGDEDSNGIPDYLDNMPSSNILPQQGNTTNSFLIECDPGVRCGLGLLARSGSSGGVQILDEELDSLGNIIIDPAFEPVGGVFDFAIRDLPTPGQSVRVVIPQRTAIPANAVYRKFQKGKWVSFISDTDNAVHSAPGNPGYCPPPGAADWQLGLTAGHLCVQLTIKDGGANDDDGLVNAAVVDPGAVSAKLPEPPAIEVKAKRGGVMSEVWLLLLAGLLVLNQVNSKRLAIAVLALVAINTQANTDSDIYARLDIYQAKGDQTRGDFNAALTNAGHDFTLNSYDVSRMAYQVAIGYGWNDFIYTEVGYLDLGDTDVNLLLNGNEDLSSFGASLTKHYPRSASGVTLSQTFIYALDSHWRITGDVGVFVWQDETNLNITGVTVSSDDGVDPILGLGVDYKITDSLRLGASLRHIAFGDQSVNLLGASLRWMF